MKTIDNLTAAEAEIIELKAANATLKTKVAELEALVKHYEERYRLQQHRMWGRSSEKTDSNQLSLFNEAEATADKKAPEPEFEQVAGHRRRKRVGKRDELYENLPSEQIVHELPENERVCPVCGGECTPAVMTFYGVRLR